MRSSKYLSSRFIFFFYLLSTVSMAQSMRDIKPLVNDKPHIIIDYGNDIEVNTRVPFRGKLSPYEVGSRLTGSNAAVFEVIYINFNATQQAAFQFAVDIWSSLLQSDVPIRIQAEMSPLGSGVLGSTSIPVQYANFDNAQKINTFYAVAMAEKMAGKELNDSGDPDIVMEFNSDFSFYYGLDGNTPGNQHDFVTIILHEIGHGLGYLNGSAKTGSAGFYIFGAPTVYDSQVETSAGVNLVESFIDGSSELGDALTSDSLFFKSFSFPTLMERPQLYAPATFSSGSSIAHLDEATYPAGNANSLMTPQINAGESVHDLGFSYEMFQDLGWVAMDIDHEIFSDTEDSLTNKTLTVVASGDSVVIAGSVGLHYTYSDFANEVVVIMTPTGNANEYSGVIPATGNEVEISYFVSLDAEGGRSFTSPGEGPKYFWQFAMAKDTIAPTISHVPLSIAFTTDLVIPINATVIDNIGAGDLSLTYKINGGATATVIVPLIINSNNGFYQGDYLLNWDLRTLVVAGDTVEYKLDIQDIAAIPNSTTNPTTGFYRISINEIGAPVNFYTNDFNAPTNDFVGSGFTIGPEVNFDSDAIQSDHPYRVVDGTTAGDSLNLIYMLKTPVILSGQDASLIFDEVALIEPGEAGTEFGDAQFWDYVIVEGSKDGGVNWRPLADGYDSRVQTAWLARWESDMDTNGNSLASGDKSLYIRNEIDMTENGMFVAGDTILVRFRIYVDQLAHGWGWAIDNIKIQVDEKPPVITQITPDYMLVGDTNIILKAKVEDNTELDSVIYEIEFNGNSQLLSFPGSAGLYSINLSFTTPIAASDVLKYRVIAVDKAPTPNTAILPSVGFFEVPVAQLGTPRNMYINDFDIATDDFVGNNFSIRLDPNFTTPALISSSPYPDAPFGTIDITYLLKFPIILNSVSAWVQYDEGVLTEPGVDMAAFEVSKDGGVNWIPVFDPYSAANDPLWGNIFSNFDSDGNSTGIGQPNMIKVRTFNMLDNSELSGGDEVLVRFRIAVNDNVHGWGWTIDNLEIQGPTTGIEDNLTTDIHVYPNPTHDGRIVLSGAIQGNKSRILVTDLLGKVVEDRQALLVNNTLQTTLELQHLQKGVYIISIRSEHAYHTSRIVVE